jgi:hypothetical protein
MTTQRATSEAQKKMGLAHLRRLTLETAKGLH